MKLYLYKIGETTPTLEIENVTSYTAYKVITEEGTIYEPLADGFELSSLSDCSETLRIKWQKENEGIKDPIEEQITFLKEQLSSTDYKIIKCSEAQLIGEELPYDITALHAERQALRDKINELERGAN